MAGHEANNAIQPCSNQLLHLYSLFHLHCTARVNYNHAFTLVTYEAAFVRGESPKCTHKSTVRCMKFCFISLRANHHRCSDIDPSSSSLVTVPLTSPSPFH